MGTMLKLKNKLRSGKGRDKRDTGAWALDEDSLRLNKQAQEDAARLQRNTAMAGTVNVTDDVEEMFYGRGTARSASARSTASDLPTYRTTEQLRTTSSALSALHEDTITRSAASNGSFNSTYSATTPANYTAQSSTYHGFSTVTSGRTTSTGELEALRAELQEVKSEVQAIRREVMNEMHVTRYDVLKELALLKGAMAQLVANTQGAPVAAASSTAEQLSAEDRAALVRAPATVTSQATRERIAASREAANTAPPAAARASVRLTQLAPVADSALSTPLRQQQIDEMFPLIDFTAELAAHARGLAPGTRTWGLTRVEEWLDSRFNLGSDALLAVVGDGGSGKSAFCGTVAQQFRANLLAAHCCQFDRKSKSSPRNVLLSFVHQLVDNLPLFKNQLARLNLKYVLEETDPFLLAAKVLVDPLNAVEEPVQAAFMLVDGLDQCAAGSHGRNELQEFLTQLLPQLPAWIGVLVSSKPSKKFAKQLPITSVLDFSAKNVAFVSDASSLVDDIARNFRDEEAEEAKRLLKQKSGGNFAYLDFTKQALSHPGMSAGVSNDEGAVPIEVLHDLPESLYEIYAEIFEDKFGKGRARVWAKAQPLLMLVVGAAAGPYAPVTEAQAKEHFSLTTDDLRMLRRSFVDLVAVRHGAYRLESSALCAWLSDPARSEEQFYVSFDDALSELRKLRRSGSSGSGSSHSGSSSSDGSVRSNGTSHSHQQSHVPSRTASSRTSNRQSSNNQRQRQHSTRHSPGSADVKPTGILKRGKL